MSRLLRFQHQPSTTYFVTDRCFQGRFLLRPSPTANAIIAGVLAHALERFKVELYGHCFMSNHYHLLLAAEGASDLAAFMQYFKGNLARKLGRHHRWKETFWSGRYHARPVLDEGAAMERMKYIFRNSIKENLVSRVRYYPGLHCHHELVDRRTLRGVWENWTATRQTGQTTVERHTLRCARLPFLADLTEHEHRKVMAQLSNEVHEEFDPKRKVLGQAKILGAHPHSTAGELQRRPQPLCHSTCPILKRAFRAAYRAFVEAYKEAFAAFKEGALVGAFPPGGLPPVGWWTSPAAPG